jgi:hypothetical protein
MIVLAGYQRVKGSLSLRPEEEPLAVRPMLRFLASTLLPPTRPRSLGMTGVNRWLLLQ